MKILITGICGFVGSSLPHALLDQDSADQISGIDNFSRPGSQLNREPLQKRGVKLIHEDLRSPSDLEAVPITDWIVDAATNPSVLAGVDLAAEAISFCRQRGLDNVYQADVCALPFVDASFDIVICSSVLYHQWVEDVAGAVREMGRVLRPGGLLLLNVRALRFLHSAHDEAVMTAHRFNKKEVRRLLLENGFAIRWLTYWTTLLFPLAVLARTLGGSVTGRDFDSAANSLTPRLFRQIMALELSLLRRTSLPIGVALLAAARKSYGGIRSLAKTSLSK